MVITEDQQFIPQPLQSVTLSVLGSDTAAQIVPKGKTTGLCVSVCACVDDDEFSPRV